MDHRLRTLPNQTILRSQRLGCLQITKSPAAIWRLSHCIRSPPLRHTLALVDVSFLAFDLILS